MTNMIIMESLRSKIILRRHIFLKQETNILITCIYIGVLPEKGGGRG
jgi:hypothetical protein